MAIVRRGIRIPRCCGTSGRPCTGRNRRSSSSNASATDSPDPYPAGCSARKSCACRRNTGNQNRSKPCRAFRKCAARFRTPAFAERPGEPGFVHGRRHRQLLQETVEIRHRLLGAPHLEREGRSDLQPGISGGISIAGASLFSKSSTAPRYSAPPVPPTQAVWNRGGRRWPRRCRTAAWSTGASRPPRRRSE